MAMTYSGPGTDRKRKVKPIGIRQDNIEDWQAPYETDIGKLAGAHPIANVIGLGIPALTQKVVGGIGNAASVMATPDTRTAAQRVSSAVEGSNLVTGVKSAFGETGTGSSIKVPVSPLIAMANAALPPAQKAVPVQPIGATPMLSSHATGKQTPLLASHGTDLNQVAQVAPAQIAPPAPTPQAVIPIGGGRMSVEGGGTATVDAQGNITRSKDWGKNQQTAGDIQAIGAMQPFRGVITPGDDFNPDGTPKFERRPEQVMVGGQLKTQMPLAQARASGLLSPSQQAFYTERDLQEQKAKNQIQAAEIGAGANRYTADQSLASHKLNADASVKAAEIGAEGRERTAIATAGQKKIDKDTEDAKGLQNKFYDSIKGLALPPGYEGKHMELAKVMAQDADPNVDLKIYYAPGQNRQGIAAVKSKYEPLLNKYLQAGMPSADAHANAYRDLQEIEKKAGLTYHKPFPNLDWLNKNDRQQPDRYTTGG
jgi:hypothetical protein